MRPRSGERGLTLIEVTIAMVVVALSAVGLAGSLMSGVAANRLYQENTILVSRSQHYLETLFNLQFGVSTDGTATQDQLDAVFGGDGELGANPPTLVELAKAVEASPDQLYRFTPPGIGLEGDFLVYVTNNAVPEIDYSTAVDGDGDTAPDHGASIVEGDITPDFPGQGAYESDNFDQGRELFAFEIWFEPAVPANAQMRLVLRGFRAQDL